MSIINELEICHCDLNKNLNELLRGIKGEENITVLGCGDVNPARKKMAEDYAQTLEAWLEDTTDCETVSLLLGEKSERKKELVGHLIKRLRDNGYEFYEAEDEDFDTSDSRIQHLEICSYNWEQNLLILLEEIGSGKRKYDWHGVGLFCACGDQDQNNNFPQMVKELLPGVNAKNQELKDRLYNKLREELQ